MYAVASSETFELAEAGREPAVALQVDRPSWWRASAMMGAMVKGTGEVAVVPRLASGGGSATRIARLAGIEPSDATLLRIRARSVVWWRGWSSGTVRLA